MPRHKLELDPPETDFLLFGICSQSKDYRLAWILNNNFDLRLKREEDVVPNETVRFSLFSFENPGTQIKFSLFSNKSDGNIFMKELRQIDFLLIINGNYKSMDTDFFLSGLKKAESVLAVYPMKPETIKSMQHFFTS